MGLTVSTVSESGEPVVCIRIFPPWSHALFNSEGVVGERFSVAQQNVFMITSSFCLAKCWLHVLESKEMKVQLDRRVVMLLFLILRGF